MNIDPARIDVGRRTKAVLAVHLFGRPAPLDDLPAGLPVLEDAAGALGARQRGRACGGLGLVGCLSFHPRKIVTTGEGGAVTTNDPELAERVRSLRHHGWSPSDRYDDMPGGAFNYRLSDMACALGLAQLERLDDMLAGRARVASLYRDALDSVDGLSLPCPDAAGARALRAARRHAPRGRDARRDGGVVARAGAASRRGRRVGRRRVHQSRARSPRFPPRRR